jgi:hypothetical protein
MWALATGENPRFGLLLNRVCWPLRALVVVASHHCFFFAAWRLPKSCGNVAGCCKFGLELFARRIYPDTILWCQLNGNP